MAIKLFSHNLMRIEKIIGEEVDDPRFNVEGVQIMKLISMLNKNQAFMKLFRRKQNNNGVMWASLISLAVSAVAYVLSKGLRQNTNENTNTEKRRYNTPSLRNFVSSITPKGNISMMNDAALTEYSEELISKAIENK
jgi:hypothetical protein